MPVKCVKAEKPPSSSTRKVKKSRAPKYDHHARPTGTSTLSSHLWYHVSRMPSSQLKLSVALCFPDPAPYLCKWSSLPQRLRAMTRRALRPTPSCTDDLQDWQLILTEKLSILHAECFEKRTALTRTVQEFPALHGGLMPWMSSPRQLRSHGT